MPHLWPALRGVLWEYWAALLVGGFWGQCSHGMPHVIRIGKAASPRGDGPAAAGRSSGRGAGAGDALPGAGKDAATGRGAVRCCVPARRGAVPLPKGVARPVRAAALGTVQSGEEGCSAPGEEGCRAPGEGRCSAPGEGGCCACYKEGCGARCEERCCASARRGVEPAAIGVLCRGALTPGQRCPAQGTGSPGGPAAPSPAAQRMPVGWLRRS